MNSIAHGIWGELSGEIKYQFLGHQTLTKNYS